MRTVLFPSRLFALTLCLPLAAQAAEWSARPGITLKTGFNDNIRLTADEHDSVWETALSPSVEFGVAREHQGLSGTAQARIRRFSGGSGRESSSLLDREDYLLKTHAFHQTPRNAFNLNLDYIEDSTLDSELDETGDVDRQRATRERFMVRPSWTGTLSEKSRLNIAYDFSSVDYQSDFDDTNLVPYDYDAFSASLIRRFNPRTQGTLSASYSRYRPDTVISSDSDTIAIQAGVTRNFSETLVASFMAGQRQITSDTVTGFCVFAVPGAGFPDCAGGIPVPTGTEEMDNSGPVFSASIVKNLLTGHLSAALSRASYPSSRGELLDTTRLILSAEHRFSETLRATLTAEYNTRETIVNRLGLEPTEADRKLLRIRPRLAWHWRREWVLAGEYEYAENENEASRKARRNAVYVSLSYRPAKIAVSR